MGRKLTLGLAFGAFGLLASASGLALLATDFDSDPLQGPLVRAPAPAPSAETAAATALAEPPASLPEVAAAKGDRIRPCAPDARAACDPLPTPRPEAVVDVSSPPAAGEAPVARSSAPAEAAPRAAAFVPDTPTGEKASVPVDPLAPTPVVVVPPADASAPLPVAGARPVAVPPPRGRKVARGRRAAPYQQFSLWPFGGGRRGSRLFW